MIQRLMLRFYSVIGNGQSGTDISVDLIDHAKSVTLIGKNSVPALPENISEVNDWFKSIASDGLILNNGESVKSDVFILCTGYTYDYTFAQVSCKNFIKISYTFTLNLSLKDFFPLDPCGKKILNLYNQMIPVGYPSLATIGVPNFILPFPLFDCQMKWVIALWRGQVKLPSIKEQTELANQNPGIGCPLIPRHFHKMGPKIFDYMNELASEAGFKISTAGLQKLFSHTFCIRTKLGPDNYRKVDYKLTNDDAVLVRTPAASEFKEYNPPANSCASNNISC